MVSLKEVPQQLSEGRICGSKRSSLLNSADRVDTEMNLFSLCYGGKSLGLFNSMRVSYV